MADAYVIAVTADQATRKTRLAGLFGHAYQLADSVLFLDPLPVGTVVSFDFARQLVAVGKTAAKTAMQTLVNAGILVREAAGRDGRGKWAQFAERVVSKALPAQGRHRASAAEPKRPQVSPETYAEIQACLLNLVDAGGQPLLTEHHLNEAMELAVPLVASGLPLERLHVLLTEGHPPVVRPGLISWRLEHAEQALAIIDKNRTNAQSKPPAPPAPAPAPAPPTQERITLPHSPVIDEAWDRRSMDECLSCGYPMRNAPPGWVCHRCPTGPPEPQLTAQEFVDQGYAFFENFKAGTVLPHP